MEVLDWARSEETLREAGVLFDRRMAPRVFQAMYENNLRRLGYQRATDERFAHLA